VSKLDIRKHSEVDWRAWGLGIAVEYDGWTDCLLRFRWWIGPWYGYVGIWCEATEQ
jgi:hypothetical protein